MYASNLGLRIDKLEMAVNYFLGQSVNSTVSSVSILSNFILLIANHGLDDDQITLLEYLEYALKL